MKRKSIQAVNATVIGLVVAVASAWCDEKSVDNDGVNRLMLLPSGPGNARNSEGDFVQLKDGRVLLVYTHYTGGQSDEAEAFLAGRLSSDGGKTWAKEDVVVVANEAKQNTMSVSLLQLKSGKVAMFYLRKNSLTDCRPFMRISTDEAKSWSEPIEVIAGGGYYVLNNDRVIQLRSGRLVVPVARHHSGKPTHKWRAAGNIFCYYSDDEGKSWTQGELANWQRKNYGVAMQEPGVVELKDGRLMMFVRTDKGSQYVTISKDRGKAWDGFRASNIISPRSPAFIERISSTSDLLLVWNNHRRIRDPNLRSARTPFNVAISRDDGVTWDRIQTLEDSRHGWYCYTAIDFVDGHVLLAHCAGDRRKTNGLTETQITRFPIKWLYRPIEQDIKRAISARTIAAIHQVVRHYVFELPNEPGLRAAYAKLGGFDAKPIKAPADVEANKAYWSNVRELVKSFDEELPSGERRDRYYAYWARPWTADHGLGRLPN